MTTHRSARGWSPLLALLATTLGAAAAHAQSTAGYDDGFFIASEDGAYRLRANAMLQARYTYEDIDEGEGADRTFESAFSLPRARLKLGGHVFSEDWRYGFQADFGSGFVTLRDYYVDAALGDGGARLRIGQFKRPFSRQFLNSGGALELVDRAITHAAFGASRDLGLMVHNGQPGDGLEWALGVFNGTGDRPRFSGTADVDLTTGEGTVSGSFRNVPDQFDPMLVGRLAYDFGGEAGRIWAYDEGDLDGGPLRAAVGISVVGDFDVADEGAMAVLAEVDYIIKVDGFAHSSALYVALAEDPSSDDDALSLEAYGLHTQLAYLIDETVQPAVRYALVDYDDGDAADRTEITGGVGVLFGRGHDLKWTTDAGYLVTGRGDGARGDVLARTQLQLAF